MDFDLSEEQALLKDTASRWAADSYDTLEKLATRLESIAAQLEAA